MTDLQHIVEGDVTEALACGGQDVGGLLHLVLFVTRHLRVFHQSHFLLLAHFIKMLLGVFKLLQVSEIRKSEVKKGHKNRPIVKADETDTHSFTKA